jgi:hypothetical protein
MNKFLFCLLPFFVGSIFFLLIGCGIGCLFGGALFTLFALEDYKNYYPAK